MIQETRVSIPYSKIVMLFFLIRRWRCPLFTCWLRVNTQQVEDTDERHRCSAGGVRQACCIQKAPVWGAPTPFSTSTLCACSLREISPCLKASDSSLYFPARSVHHIPPPAPPTILQFLTSSRISRFHSSCWCFCLFVSWLEWLNWHAGRCSCRFPSTLINSFPPY